MPIIQHKNKSQDKAIIHAAKEPTKNWNISHLFSRPRKLEPNSTTLAAISKPFLRIHVQQPASIHVHRDTSSILQRLQGSLHHTCAIYGDKTKNRAHIPPAKKHTRRTSPIRAHTRASRESLSQREKADRDLPMARRLFCKMNSSRRVCVYAERACGVMTRQRMSDLRKGVFVGSWEVNGEVFKRVAVCRMCRVLNE